MNTRTDYLTRAQMFDIFGTDDNDGIIRFVETWNNENTDKIQLINKPGKIVDIPAGSLPDLFASRLDELEYFGIKYCGDSGGPPNHDKPEPARIRKDARHLWHSEYPGYASRTVSLEVSRDITECMELLTIETPADINGGPCEQCQNDECCEYDCNAMQVTFACNETGTEWNYQTGDNSYTGSCYPLPHWAVVCIGHDSDRPDVAADVIKQLNEMIN